MGKHKRRRESEDSVEGATEPLGKLINQHQANLAAALVVGGIVGLFGIGALIYALTQSPVSTTFLIIGTAALLLAILVPAKNAASFGHRLELRKRGVRFVEPGKVSEFYWDEVATIEVKRTDQTNLGMVTVRKRSSNAVRPSGPLTTTEWDVTIHATDGRSMHLRPAFMRTVRDPKGLISQLKLRAGLP